MAMIIKNSNAVVARKYQSADAPIVLTFTSPLRFTPLGSRNPSLY